jgi:TP901 family phage tail tape measure protein
MADLALRITSVFEDNVSRGLLGLLNPLNLLQGGLMAAALGLAALGLAAVVVGVIGGKMAADFQQGLTRLKTGAGDVTDNMRVMGQGILGVSVATGILTNGTDGLTAAMYLVISAHQRGAQALDTLRVAAQGAQLEQAKVIDVTQILTTIQTDFGLKTHTAAQYMDGLIAAVKNGKITLEALSVAMSPLMPQAKELGVHFADVAAAMSQMTNMGIPADQAAQALRFTMQSMILPTKGSLTAMKEWGLNTVAVAAEMKTSLPGAIQMYIDAAKRAGPEGSKPFIDALSQMMGGGQRAAKALFSLSQSMGDWKTIIGQVNTALGTNATDVTGWSDVLGNVNIQVDRGKAAMAALAIVIGNQLLPYVMQFLQWLIPLIGQFAIWIDKTQIVKQAMDGMIAAVRNTGTAIQQVIGFYQQWKPIIDNTAIAIAFFFVPAIILAGVRSVISAAQITYNFIASLILTGTEGWAAAFKLGAFIGAMAVSGAQAVWAGAVITYNFVASLVKAVVQSYLLAYALYGSVIPALSAMAVAAYASLGPWGLLLGALVGILAAMKAISDQMNLGMTYAIDNMGNHIQRSTGRIIQSADQMKQGVTSSTQQMSNNVDSITAAMDAISTNNVQSLSQNAIALMGKMGVDVTTAMQGMSQNTIRSWNNLSADFIAQANQMTVKGSTAMGQLGYNTRQHFVQMAAQSSQTVGQMATDVPAQISTMDTNVQSRMSSLGSNITTTFDKTRTDASSKVSAMSSDVTAKFTTIATNGKTQFANLAANIATGLNTAKSSIFSISNQMVATLQSAWANAAAQAYTGGINIGGNLAGGLYSQVGLVAGAASALAGAISSRLPHSPVKEGPLRDLENAGKLIVAQLNAGMLSAQPTLAATMNMLLAPVGAAAAPVGGSAAGAGGQTVINHYHFETTVNAPALSQRESKTLADAVNVELAKKYRGQTSRASSGVQ